MSALVELVLCLLELTSSLFGLVLEFTSELLATAIDPEQDRGTRRIALGCLLVLLGVVAIAVLPLVVWRFW
jgi:hypothetical protein